MLPSKKNVVSKRGGFPARSWVFAACALLALAACDDDDDDAVPPPERPGPNPSRVLAPGQELPGIRLAVTEVTGGTQGGGSFRPGDVITVRYTAKTADGSDLDVAALDGGSIYVSGPTFNYQRVIAAQTDLRSASVYEGNGVWAYRFAAPVPSTYLPPLNDTASLGDGELTGQALLGGTYTVGMQFDATYSDDRLRDYVDAGGVAADFSFGGAPIVARAAVQNDNCNVCHTDLRAHGDKVRDVRLCVLCHTAGAEDDNTGGATPGVTIEFKVMIHKIHNGSHLASVLGVHTDTAGARVYPGTLGYPGPQPLEYADAGGGRKDFSGVNFPVWPNLNVAMPRDLGYSALSSVDPDGAGPLLSARAVEDRMRTGVTDCAKCHGDPDAGGPLAAPAQGQVAWTQPTRRACGSCHDDVDWAKIYHANGLAMGPQADDATCIVCHTDTAANQSNPAYGLISVTEAHVHPLLAPVLDPGVNSVITHVSGGTGPGGNFRIGDTPTLTFTLKNDAGQDIGLSTMDSCSAFYFGPTTNPQLVMPYPSPNGMSLNPFDFAGRLQAASTGNKGTMSKVVLGATAVAETLTVDFTSATAFTVNRVDPATGTVSGSLGTGALPTSPSTNPAGSSISALALGPALGSGSIQVVFSSATHFDVSGLVTGSGDLPAATSASTRFVSTDLSFNISVGTTAFAAGNTVNVALFRGSAANPVLFAIVGGRTAFATGDRFCYDIVPDAPSYTVEMPMDLVFECLGDGSGAVPQTFTAGNLPVYWGRQTLWEATTTGTTTNTAVAAAAFDRYVDVNASTGWANGDTVVVDALAPVGIREYVQVAPARADGVIAAAADTTVRLWFKTPLRYGHAANTTITKVTLAFRREGTNYTLVPATGVITAVTPFTLNNGVVMSYRSNATFGHKRHAGDAVRAVYVPPANDSTDIGQEQGDWQGLPYQDGTYTADIWFYKNLDLGLQNELQTYRSTSNAGTADFLYGAATTIEPHAIISTSANCYSCHNDLIFHGGGRRGLDACLTCHAIPGNEDKPRWDTPKVGSSTTDTALTPGVAIEFRQMLHKIHLGAGLTNASTYTVVGNGGNPSNYGEVEFPAMPGGARQCIRCHGNDAWKEPARREHLGASLPVKKWTVVCSACHDSDGARTHMETNTSSFGYESCEVCHGPGREQSVEKAHWNR